MHENANSAIKLGQARGAAIVALDIPVTEYSASQVKQSVVGSGGAENPGRLHGLPIAEYQRTTSGGCSGCSRRSPVPRTCPRAAQAWPLAASRLIPSSQYARQAAIQILFAGLREEILIWVFTIIQFTRYEFHISLYTFRIIEVGFDIAFQYMR